LRIDRLHLERYGAFSDTWLDFRGEGVRLHVLHGPNEAGKSTIRSAITDLLYGIHGQSPFAFRHGYNSMRVGAELTSSDARTLSFKRRKGNKDTLITFGVTETALPDGVLQPFLGGTSRETFTTMFALDQEKLRIGGDNMIGPKGDLAKSLLEAGTGMAGVGAALQALEDEIAEIGDLARKSSTKPVWVQLGHYELARKDANLNALRADQWKAAEGRLADTRKLRESLGGQLRGVRTRATQLRRVRAVAPFLNEIRILSARLDELRDAPDLAPEIDQEWAAAERRLGEAAARVRRGVTAAAEARAKAEASAVPGAVIEMADAIGALQKNIGRFMDAESGIPELRAAVETEAGAIRALAGRLGISGDIETVAELVPTISAAEKLRGLISDAMKADASAETAVGELIKARAAHRRAEAALAALPLVADPSAANAMLAELAKPADLVDQLEKAVADREAADLLLDEAVGRLEGWTHTPDELAACPFPDMSSVQRHEDRLRSAEEALDRASQEVRRLGGEKVGAEADLAALLETGEDIPHASAVKEARAQRDFLWGAIRSVHIEGVEASAAQAGVLAEEGIVTDRFEALTMRADQLVDRREAEAARVQQHEAATLTRHRAMAKLVDAEQERARHQETHSAAERDWAVAWEASGVRPGSPSDMRGWLVRKDEVLRLLADQRRGMAAVKEATKAAERARSTLRSASAMVGVNVDDAMTLAEVHGLVSARVTGAASAIRDRQEAERQVLSDSLRVAEAQSAVTETTERALSCRKDLSTGMPGLGLSEGAGADEADKILTAWDGIRQCVDKLREEQSKLATSERAMQSFRAQVTTLVAGLGTVPPGIDPDRKPREAAEALATLLNEARDAEVRRAEALEALADRERELGKAQRELDGAADDCAALRRSCGAESNDEVSGILCEAEEARQKRAKLAEARSKLLEAGEGFTEEHLQAELLANPIDKAYAELQELESEEDRLTEAGQAAAQDETEAKRVLETHGGGRIAAIAAQEAADAAQEAAALAERWAVMTTAKAMLERAVERYRNENQDPLVTRGGEIFTRLAGTGANPIIRLRVGYLEGGAPDLEAVRQDLSSCDVKGMSEGTRDQLFLSLRLAAVERHVASFGPMPFLADDLFVTTDEERLARGLEALAALGERTQVILFTHHRHVAEAATDVSGAVVQRLPSYTAGATLAAAQ